MTTPAGDQGTGPATGQPGSATGAADPNAQTGGQPPATDPNADPNAGDGGTPTTADPAKELEKWKALSRKHEARAKENSKAAEQLAALQDKDKSELQRATERAAKAEADRLTERSERFRLLAAAQHGLGPDMVGYLGTGEQEEIEERAASLRSAIDTAVQAQLVEELAKYGIQLNQNGQPQNAAAAASMALGRRPVESLRPGSAPSGNGVPASKNDMFRGMLGRGWQ